MDYAVTCDVIDVEGVVLPNRPLTNFEIDAAVKQMNIPHFRGCFCRDELTKPHKQECGILNLDDSNGNGTHWVAWYKNDELKIYFDSYGHRPPLEMIEYLRSPMHRNTDRIQPDGSMVCGHLCLYVLKRLTMGDSFQDVLNSLI